MKEKWLRLFTSLFFPVAKNRVGRCNGCGDCCKLPNVCPFLKEYADGSTRCKVYFFRPPSCRKYPRAASEFLTAENCGFSFTAQKSRSAVVHHAKPAEARRNIIASSNG
jgi:Fe-S-cluster containining protein